MAGGCWLVGWSAGSLFFGVLDEREDEREGNMNRRIVQTLKFSQNQSRGRRKYFERKGMNRPAVLRRKGGYISFSTPAIFVVARDRAAT